MTVARLQREMSEREFQEWLVYEQLEPWDEWRADLRSATICATMANVWRGKDSEPFTPADFMPDFEAQAVTAEEAEDAVDDEDAEDQAIAATQAFFAWMTESAGGVIE
jgi:hypothetical protein